MKNNLFYYATSELSQDAFICWLASFALDDVDTDLHLKECAKEMICLFVPEFNKEKLVLRAVEKQVNNIDVLLTVSYQRDTYKIIIEDKTFTSEHDNQLLRYVNQVKEVYPHAKIRGVYYKTGFQSDLKNVQAANYAIVTRKDILSLMKPYTEQTKNQIFKDYYEYWNDFQNRVDEYLNKPIVQWKWEQINGFYESLKSKNRLDDLGLWVGYGYVANQTGGFDGFWTGFHDYLININGTEFELYLQMEAKTGDEMNVQICLKMCVKDKNVNADIIRSCRDKVVYNENWEYILKQYNYVKPKRLALGKHMTIGVYDTDYTDSNSLEEALMNAIDDYKLILQKWK